MFTSDKNREYALSGAGPAYEKAEAAAANEGRPLPLLTGEETGIKEDTDRKLVRAAFLYLCVSAFCALFGAVYEVFSHQVYSMYMIYAFAIPLLLGALPLLGLVAMKTNTGTGFLPAKDVRKTDSWKKAEAWKRIAANAWNSGVAALTVGCIFRGVLDIYGTTNRLLIVYPVAAACLLAAGAAAFLKAGTGSV